MLIDTHSHLYSDSFDGDREEAVGRAAENGVGKIILPAIDSASHAPLLAMCGDYPDMCYPLMGLHPTSVNDNPRWRDELATVEKFVRTHAAGEGPRFYGIGEVGMDLYWSRDYETEQEEAFRFQVELALEFSLPVIIHTREAWSAMRRILGSYRGRGLRGIMHSFSGTLEDYRFILGCGDFLFGVGGPVTYNKSALAEILPYMELSHLVLETDSPYLPPVPLRGKRNESSYIVYIRDKVAEITGLSCAEVTETTTANARRMFGI
ncbi:MAG: TatD family hydrolase [Rikenellaceae bacterium]|nr:TatD family hydrolase [Rikenellaceae bacterium]